MPALPPKADIRSAKCNVCYGPQADMVSLKQERSPCGATLPALAQENFTFLADALLNEAQSFDRSQAFCFRLAKAFFSLGDALIDQLNERFLFIQPG